MPKGARNGIAQTFARRTSSSATPGRARFWTKSAVSSFATSLSSMRFPGHEIDCSAFLRADPPAPARATLEERVAPQGPVALLIAPASSGRLATHERVRQIEDSGSGFNCIHCELDDVGGCMTIRSVRGAAPQSLAFALADPSALKRLQDYLTRARPESVEVFAPHALPDTILRLAYALGVPVRLALGDLHWIRDREFAFGTSCQDAAFPGECGVCILPQAPTPEAAERSRTADRRRTREALREAEAIIPLDRMAEPPFRKQANCLKSSDDGQPPDQENPFRPSTSSASFWSGPDTRMALWPAALCAAQTGRTHGRTNQRCSGAKKPLPTESRPHRVDSSRPECTNCVEKLCLTGSPGADALLLGVGDSVMGRTAADARGTVLRLQLERHVPDTRSARRPRF